MPCLDQTNFGSHTLECFRIIWGAWQESTPGPKLEPKIEPIPDSKARTFMYLIGSQGILMNTQVQQWLRGFCWQNWSTPCLSTIVLYPSRSRYYWVLEMLSSSYSPRCWYVLTGRDKNVIFKKSSLWLSGKRKYSESIFSCYFLIRVSV